MKKTILIFMCLLMVTGNAFCQSVERSVVAGAGDYFEGTTASLSWTLGEIATETLENGNVVLTQGFQQPDIILRIYVDITAFLEGPFNGSGMNHDLSDLDLLPVFQPYNMPPWNYPGTESLGIVPIPNKVDWVLIELRDAPDAASATAATMVARQAALLLSDGSVVKPNGQPDLEFDVTIQNQLFAVIWHRNHLGMMSAFPLAKISGVYAYNFTTALGMAYLNGQKSLGPDWDAFGMVSGDADANGTVENPDKNSFWTLQAGQKGYRSADFNMDGNVSNPDKNDMWYVNRGASETVP